MLQAASTSVSRIGVKWTRCIGSVVSQSRIPVLPSSDSLRSPAFPSQTQSFAADAARSLHSLGPMAIVVHHPAALKVQIATKATVPRDPERPKRPISAYFRFAAACREKGVKHVKEIGDSWKSLTPMEKQPYEQATAKELEVYQKAFGEYKASGKLDAFKRDPNRPSRPLTAYMAWTQEQRRLPEYSSLTVSEAAKKLGTNWKLVPSATKAPLEETFKREMGIYNTAMKAYKESGKEQQWLERTGRADIMRKADAKKQAAKDKLKAEKDKLKAKLAKAKTAEKAKADKLKEKEKAKKAKMNAAEKAKAHKEKTKAKLRKEKMAAAKAKEKAKLEKDNLKAKEKKAAKQEKAKLEKDNLKAKEKKAAEQAKKDKLKAKEAKAKEQEKAKLKRQKENEKAKKAKVQEREKAAKAKAKAKEALAKKKAKEVAAKAKALAR